MATHEYTTRRGDWNNEWIVIPTLFFLMLVLLDSYPAHPWAQGVLVAFALLICVSIPKERVTIASRRVIPVSRQGQQLVLGNGYQIIGAVTLLGTAFLMREVLTVWEHLFLWAFSVQTGSGARLRWVDPDEAEAGAESQEAGVVRG